MKCQNTNIQIWYSLLFCTFVCGDAIAQMHLKANLQNMHLWRGMEVTDGVVLTTDLSVTDRKIIFVPEYGVVQIQTEATKNLIIISPIPVTGLV